MRRIFEILFLIVLLSSCSGNEVNEKLIPKEVDNFAKNYIDSLKNGKIEYCFNMLEAQHQNEEARMIYLQAYESLKEKNLIYSKLVSFKKRKIYSEYSTVNYGLIYEYQYSENLWVYYIFQLFEAENDFIVQTFNIQANNQSLSKIHDFSLKNKPIINYIWFLFLVIIPAFIIYSIIYVIRTPLKRKWLWIIFMLFGFASFSLNWTSSEINFDLLYFKLFGAGIIRSGIIEPWILSFSIPVGAILFWIKRNKIIKETKNDNELEVMTKNKRKIDDVNYYESNKGIFG